MAVAEAALIRAEQVAQLDSRASALSGRINALEGELTQTIAELFDLKAHEGVGWRSPGHYVAWLTGTARGRTKALVTTAQNLTAFPLTVGRLNSGEISLDQAAAVVGTAPAWADQAMAEASGSMTPGQLATAARIHRAVEQAQHADETASTTPTRSAPPVDEFAVFHADDTGAYRGRLRLDADHGAEFEAALRAHLEVLWNQWKAGGGIGRRPGPVDAFLRMMRRAAEADRASLGPTTDHHRHLVVLHVDVNTQVGQAHMGPVLPTWVTEAWSCDATCRLTGATPTVVEPFAPSSAEWTGATWCHSHPEPAPRHQSACQHVTMTSQIHRRSITLGDVTLGLLEAGTPGQPVIILAHGFPECAWSWRHQLPALAAAGFHVLAPDQRGYAHSTAPHVVAAYGIDHLAGDLIALLDSTGHDQGVFVGHDWGALVTWDLARLFPQRVRAVVGVSVPFTPWPMRPTELFAAAFGDRFFYMNYFQPVGPAERELEADVRHTMHTILWGASGEQYRGRPTDLPPAEGTGFLDMFVDVPDRLPAWLTPEDFEHYVDAFTASGFFGPVSWYRNLDANFDRMHDLPPSLLTMPSYFIGGDRDGVIAGRPEMVDAMVDLLPGYCGKTMLQGAGHWTQQERPEEFNEALLTFLQSL